MKKRLLSIILALAMCLGLLPATAPAETRPGNTDAAHNEKPQLSFENCGFSYHASSALVSACLRKSREMHQSPARPTSV